MVLEYKASFPIAVLAPPELFAVKAFTPKAELLSPDVIEFKALVPVEVLSVCALILNEIVNAKSVTLYNEKS